MKQQSVEEVYDKAEFRRTYRGLAFAIRREDEQVQKHGRIEIRVNCCEGRRRSVAAMTASFNAVQNVGHPIHFSL